MKTMVYIKRGFQFETMEISVTSDETYSAWLHNVIIKYTMMVVCMLKDITSLMVNAMMMGLMSHMTCHITDFRAWN